MNKADETAKKRALLKGNEKERKTVADKLQKEKKPELQAELNKKIADLEKQRDTLIIEIDLARAERPFSSSSGCWRALPRSRRYWG